MVRLARAYPNNALLRRRFKPVVAPAYDATGAAGSGLTPVTFSHTASAGAYGLVIFTFSTGFTFTPVKIGTTTLTLLGSSADTAGGYSLYMYGANGLAAGAQTVSIPNSGSGQASILAANSISVKGVTSAGTPLTQTGSASQTVTATANQFIVQAFEDANVGALAGWSGGTARYTNSTMSISTNPGPTTTFATTDTNLTSIAGIAVVLS